VFDFFNSLLPHFLTLPPVASSSTSRGSTPISQIHPFLFLSLCVCFSVKPLGSLVPSRSQRISEKRGKKDITTTDISIVRHLEISQDLQGTQTCHFAQSKTFLMRSLKISRESLRKLKISSNLSESLKISRDLKLSQPLGRTFSSTWRTNDNRLRCQKKRRIQTDVRGDEQTTVSRISQTSLMPSNN
jgi:hypothetical protein